MTSQANLATLSLENAVELRENVAPSLGIVKKPIDRLMHNHPLCFTGYVADVRIVLKKNLHQCCYFPRQEFSLKFALPCRTSWRTDQKSAGPTLKLTMTRLLSSPHSVSSRRNIRDAKTNRVRYLGHEE